MPAELDGSRLAVADEVKFDMLAAISDLGDHAKQYNTISRNLVCECSARSSQYYILYMERSGYING